jgi:hypothetical protein
MTIIYSQQRFLEELSEEHDKVLFEKADNSNSLSLKNTQEVSKVRNFE